MVTTVASATLLEIIVRNDTGVIKENVTITFNPANGTGNEVFLKVWVRSRLLERDEIGAPRHERVWALAAAAQHSSKLASAFGG